MIRQAVVVSAGDGKYAVRYRERPEWWPFWWPSEWHKVQRCGSEAKFERVDAEALASLATKNGCVIVPYGTYCRAIEDVYE